CQDQRHQPRLIPGQGRRASPGSVKHQLDTGVPATSAVEPVLDHPRVQPPDIPSHPLGVSSTSLTQPYPSPPRSSQCSTIPGSHPRTPQVTPLAAASTSLPPPAPPPPLPTYS